MTGAPATVRGVRRHVDWRRAAQLLADGRSLSETARLVGCTRGRVSRHLRRDEPFQRLIERLRQDRTDDDGSRLLALRRRVHEAIESEVQKGNVRVILWLADRLKLVTPPAERAPDDQLDDLLRSLSPEELVEFEALKDTA